MSVPSMGAEDGVVDAKMGADPGGDGLLSNVSVARPGDGARLVGPGQLFFAPTDNHHRAIEREQNFFFE